MSKDVIKASDYGKLDKVSNKIAPKGKPKLIKTQANQLTYAEYLATKEKTVVNEDKANNGLNVANHDLFMQSNYKIVKLLNDENLPIDMQVEVLKVATMQVRNAIALTKMSRGE